MKLNNYVYKGLLKKPPMNVDIRDYQWSSPYVDEFMNCCAIGIFNDFPLYEIRKYKEPGDWLGEYTTLLPIGKNLYSNEEALSVAVAYVDSTIKRECLPNNRKRGPYLLVALNEKQINKGWSDVLEEYFGFYRIEDDFRNFNHYSKNSRIRLLGLCFTNFCDSK